MLSASSPFRDSIGFGSWESRTVLGDQMPGRVAGWGGGGAGGHPERVLSSCRCLEARGQGHGGVSWPRGVWPEVTQSTGMWGLSHLDSCRTVSRLGTVGCGHSCCSLVPPEPGQLTSKELMVCIWGGDT